MAAAAVGVGGEGRHAGRLPSYDLTVDTTRGVARLEAATGSRFERIGSARRETDRRLNERVDRLTALEIDADGTIVLMGSWGRREVTSESDDDFMVLVDGAERNDPKPAVAAVANALDARPPGPEENFGSHVWLGDLRHKIGRDEDTKREPHPPDAPRTRVGACRGRGDLPAGTARAGGRLPRRQRQGPPPAAVLPQWRDPLLADDRGDGMLDYLDERMSLPPLDRIADAFVDHDALDAGVRTLTAYDAFLAILDREYIVF
jgi:hypothetical protein